MPSVLMALRLPDRWLWDFWLAAAGGQYHVFYLQAPRSIGDPDQRHWNVSIGHAVSTDLVDWEVQQDALGPGEAGAWDDYTTWTGSVVQYKDRWAMLYTGTTQRDAGLIQRIGVAWSDDLIHWVKEASNPILEIDPGRYELLDLALWHDQAWRDPSVFVHPDDSRFHVLLTARTTSGPPATRGVIAHAVSDNLLAWDVLDPITAPGVFGHLEIPQLVQENGRWFLLFSAPAGPDSLVLGGDAALTGTHYMSADAPVGPFEWRNHGVVLADKPGTWYGAKVIRNPRGDWVALAWENVGSDGEFGGTLSDPMPVTWGSGPTVSEASGG